MRYEVNKISVTTYKADGSKVYDLFREYNNIQDVFSLLMGERSTFTSGKGSDIFKNGVLIANTDDVHELENELYASKEKPTLKRLIEIHRENRGE